MNRLDVSYIYSGRMTLKAMILCVAWHAINLYKIFERIITRSFGDRGPPFFFFFFLFFAFFCFFLLFCLFFVYFLLLFVLLAFFMDDECLFPDAVVREPINVE